MSSSRGDFQIIRMMRSIGNVIGCVVCLITLELSIQWHNYSNVVQCKNVVQSQSVAYHRTFVPKPSGSSDIYYLAHRIALLIEPITHICEYSSRRSLRVFPSIQLAHFYRGSDIVGKYIPLVIAHRHMRTVNNQTMIRL